MGRTLSHATVRPAARDRSRSARAALAILSVLVLAACGMGETADLDPATATANFAWPTGPHPRVVVHIENRGTILLELYPELAPRTVENFVALARAGFYDGTTFHRVVPGFMIQGGDPNSRDDDPGNDGDGGPGFTLPDEFGPAPHIRGTVSMANRGQANSGGSQFFIVQGDARHLDGRHSVFGRVAAGIEIADSIAAVETDVYGRWGKANRPLENVVIERIEIFENSLGGTSARPSALSGSHLGLEPSRLFPALAMN